MSFKILTYVKKELFFVVALKVNTFYEQFCVLMITFIWKYEVVLDDLSGDC